jgi:beta-lactamase class A
MIKTILRGFGCGALMLTTPGLAQPPASQPTAATAQAITPAELSRRAEDVANLLRGQGDPSQAFSPSFLAHIPAAQLQAVTQQLTAAHGALQRVESVEPVSTDRARIAFAMERAIVRMEMALDAEAPHRISGLVVSGVEPRGGDSAASVITELRALPGQVNFAIARLDGPQPTLLNSIEPDRPLALGSAFKLVILAELSRQVQAGQHRWNEVVPLDRHSLPSGMLQQWPLGSPLTLHSLASLMISISDNTATDVLLHLAGRENVERMMTRIGMQSAARNRPFLSTMEAFQLKSEDAQNLARWTSGDEAARRAWLRERYERGGSEVDVSRLMGDPHAIDTVEWFASANDLVRVMDWLRRNGDDTTRAIMAINPGLGRQVAGEFGYMGFKGGSEPGVINLTFLIRNNAGTWHVVTAGWNNPAAPVDEAKFVGLLSRAVRLVR